MPVLDYVWEGIDVLGFDDFCTTGVHTWYVHIFTDKRSNQMLY